MNDKTICLFEPGFPMKRLERFPNVEDIAQGSYLYTAIQPAGWYTTAVLSNTRRAGITWARVPDKDVPAEYRTHLLLLD